MTKSEQVEEGCAGMKRSRKISLTPDGDVLIIISDKCQYCSYEWHVAQASPHGSKSDLSGLEESLSEHAQWHHVRAAEKDECRSICDCDEPDVEHVAGGTYRVRSQTTFALLQVGGSVRIGGIRRMIMAKYLNSNCIKVES